jgi:transposase
VANGSGEPSATALVGMDGFVVKSQIVRDGEHWLLVETTGPSRWCPSCGVAGVGNGRRRVIVRDLPIAGVPTVLVWDKRTFRCREQLCERRSWSETSPLIASRASLTERARAEICRRVGARLGHRRRGAREFGVGWQCVRADVVDADG